MGIVYLCLWHGSVVAWLNDILTVQSNVHASKPDVTKCPSHSKLEIKQRELPIWQQELNLYPQEDLDGFCMQKF